MDDGEAVERVVDKLHFVIALTRQIHEESELSELSHHQVLIGCLFIEHGLQYSCVIQRSGYSNEVIRSLLVFAELLEELYHHE